MTQSNVKLPAPLDTLPTPCLLLDEARVRANVARMQAHLSGLGVAFRPHLKTAKSLDVARITMRPPRDLRRDAVIASLSQARGSARGGRYRSSSVTCWSSAPKPV